MASPMKKLMKKAHHSKYVLLLMRHAKSEAPQMGDDWGRGLTDKGLKQAKIMAKGLQSLKLVPDYIVCSSANRTEQTLKRMLKRFGDAPVVESRKSLYDGGMQSVMNELQAVRGDVHTTMIVGHEPTMSMAAQWLSSPDSDPDVLGAMRLGLANASVVVLVSDRPFATCGLRGATALAILTPKSFA
ncbi:SixA phosphatase family protein [Gardnerella greenwoodii]|uniref:Phosphoglycerate mutase n=1 Tax=Gardnerella greenwoodii TaxID=2914925 RepID=A0A2N6RXN4_9BIFI|nr:histidine phosphatase family protein [Gardnerella greenwoodii]MDF0753665.1 histidine phosphatase family protein [Gardnerella greenwoodii]PMC42783.1 phosphoglycerate mutase [Gardnerella greenwoodii]